jgi:hypothetical protein
MLLRVIRGTVSAGRESDFVAVCRQQVADFGRAAGLVAFISGYRRVDGVDEFVLGSTWESDELAASVAGAADNPVAAGRLSGIATIGRLDVYDVVEPAFRGIVDAPGGVVRFTSGKVANEDHARMISWLRNPRGDRAKDIQHLMLGWAVGERPTDDGTGVEVVALSAWPSPLVIEAIADPNRSQAPLYAEIDDFAADFHVDVYRAIGLELPDAMADIGSRRVIAARFSERQAADEAALALTGAVARPHDAHISVAPLGAPGQAASDGSYVLVARVAINEFGRAERLIADQGGEVILSQRETMGDALVVSPADAPLTGASLRPGFLPAK